MKKLTINHYNRMQKLKTQYRLSCNPILAQIYTFDFFDSIQVVEKNHKLQVTKAFFQTLQIHSLH